MTILENFEAGLEGRPFTPQELSAFYFALEDRPRFKSYEAWNRALWREDAIRTRINKMIRGGEWPPPVGWCTDLLSEDLSLPEHDFLEVASAKEAEAGLFKWGTVVSEFPADWTPEQCAKYLELMESKRNPKIISIPTLRLDPARTAEPKAKVEKPTAKPSIDLDSLDLGDDEDPKAGAKAKTNRRQNDERPNARWKIALAAGNDHLTASTAEGALIDSGAEIYHRGLGLVRPVIQEMRATGNRTTKIAQLISITPDFLLDQLSQRITWIRDSEGNEVRTGPPRRIAQTLLARSGMWKFPEVFGIISTPTLRPDGSLLNTPGYDPQTKLILFEPPPVPALNTRPTRDEGLAALNLLDGLLNEFAFVDAPSRSVALSALITPVVRGALGCVPMHVGRAPLPGSGKSYLFETAAAIAIGQPCPVMAVAKDEETEKRVGAALLASQPIISIDNVNDNDALGGSFLCQAISQRVVQVRPLGRSEQVTIQNSSTFFATGNNIRLLNDMTRRAVMCLLDARVERPELREFRQNPVETVLSDRGRFIAAALAVALAYQAAGKPDQLRPLASFEDWSNLVRSALVWLGRADPVDTMELVRAEDPKLQVTQQIFSGMAHKFGKGETNAKFCSQIINAVQTLNLNAPFGQPNSFREGLMAVALYGNELSPVRLGKWFGSRRDVIAGGLLLKGRHDQHEGTSRWWVEDVNE